jgi:hypothetical protein
MKILGMKVVLIVLAFALAAVAQGLPRPEIRLVGVADAVNNGYPVKAYEIEVVNRGEYSDDLFLQTAVLPPCGKNPNASRTWINLYVDRGARIQGWCVIKDSGELASLRFNIAARAPQPKTIFIDLVDRFEGIVVRSNKIKIE